MNLQRSLFTSVLFSSLLTLSQGACVTPGDGPADDRVDPADDLADVPTSETAQSLSVFNWSAPAQVVPGAGGVVKYPQVATIAGRIIMVNPGPGQAGTQLYWRERDPSGVWLAETAITGQSSGSKVSLAAFNGFLYMVRTSPSNATQLWVSRFDPATSTWSSSFLISHVSHNGPPALAAYNGSLYLVGVDPATKRLWSATMSAAEVFSPSVLLAPTSESRVSAAVFQCRLYVAHRNGNGTTIVYNRFDGLNWSSNLTIPAGPGGAQITGHEAVFAERSNYLHLLHRIPHDGAGTTPREVWWTYFNGATWPAEVSVGTTTTFFAPSLTTGGPGLVATVEPFSNVSSSMTFTQALPPRAPEPCIIVQPPNP